MLDENSMESSALFLWVNHRDAVLGFIMIHPAEISHEDDKFEGQKKKAGGTYSWAADCRPVCQNCKERKVGALMSR